MKIKTFYAATFMGALAFSSCNKSGNESATLTSENDKVSYSLGVMMGNNLKKSGVDTINGVALAAAISDVYASADLKVTEDSAKQILDAYFGKIRDQKTQEAVEEGKKFLEENKSKPGIVELPSGLQYQIVTAGTGPKPTASDKVTVNYTGKLLNGTVFDSSIERKQPASFPVSGVIPGWTEALQLMPVGSKWNLFIPSNLAYGEHGAGGTIPPNSTLVFEVELLSIDK